MTDKQRLQKEILDLKNKKEAILLVHNYQRAEIQEIADFLGDSLELSQKSALTDQPTIVFCGVRFMAETAKILSPNKKVLLPRNEASCPMAEMVDIEGLKKLKAAHPNATVVTYVNSTAEIKAESDICCTSANAIRIVQAVKSNEIIFTPDRNLAAYVQRFTDKKIIPWEGFCYVHDRFTLEEILEAKKNHPNGVLLVHPECRPDIINLADKVLSTSGMIKYVRDSDAEEFLIGTEEGLIHRLKRENPKKRLYSAGSAKMCRGMKMTGLEDVYQSILQERNEIFIPENLMTRSRIVLDKMLAYG